MLPLRVALMMPPPSQIELECVRKSEARARRNSGKRRAPSKRPKVLVPSLQPWRAVVLAVDPGEVSGWAIYAHGKLVTFGQCDVFDHAEVAKIVRAAAITMAELSSLPPVLVLERPWSARTLGPSRALWGKAWEMAGMSARRIVRCYPARWRAQLFGGGMHCAKQEHVRRVEQLRAQAIAARGNAPIQHDAAAALCIGAWACRAAEVGSVLPVAFRSQEAG